MIVYRLKPHSDFAHPAIDLAVEVSRSDSALSLKYQLEGAIEEVALPPVHSPTRADRLWQHTCFEAFIRPIKGEGYFEFNFSPSRAWAIYEFDRYRENMCAPTGVAAPRIGIPIAKGMFELHPVIYPKIAEPAALGLSAVIEAKDGTKSYWALAHAPGPPDFHNPDCFIATLPAPTAP